MPRRARRLLVAPVAAAAVLALVLAGCTTGSEDSSASAHARRLDPHPTAVSAESSGPTASFADAGPTGIRIATGDDWTLPDWVRPATNSGFFSEDADASEKVDVHSVDVTWKQIQPTEDGPIDLTATGEAEGMKLPSLKDQLDGRGAFWMRIFASGRSWAPDWVVKDCGVTTYGPDYDGQRHLPIWNECVWGHLMDTYRAVFVTGGLAADPRLEFVYVPGAFTWAEFDYDMIGAAVKTGDLDWATYRKWYDHAWTDLTDVFGAAKTKMVFTGEDYPFGPFGAKDDLLAQQATEAGMGIRTGITEESNFHLNEAPAYGSRIQPDGHMIVDETLPIHNGKYVVATENECFTDCGYRTKQLYYAVRQANLKALQLRMNWMYVVPGPSAMARYPAQWDWVRLSLGQTASTSADAWADLRDAEDTYWKSNGLARFSDSSQWTTLPYVRNLERWLVQTDVPGSVAHRTDADVHKGVFGKDNGTAYEGLSTDAAAGDTGLAFDVDPRYAAAAGSASTVLKVTYLDRGTGSFRVDTPAGSSASVTRTGDGAWKTATIALPAGALGGAHRLRVSLASGADDLVVRFVRVVRLAS